MTTTRKRLTAVCAALALILTSIFTVGGLFGKQAHALVPEYTGDFETIYYFTDYCQAVDPITLAKQFPDRSIVVDRQTELNESKLREMVYEEGYFYGLNNWTFIVIDIKTFKPDPVLLYDIFFSLNVEQDCRTAFVTVYEYNQYEEDGTTYDPWFMDYVDIYIDDSDYDRLKSFTFNAFRHTFNNNGTVNNTAYIIDSNLVDIGTERDLESDPFIGGVDDEGNRYDNNNFGADLETLCKDSAYLDIFVKELACWKEMPDNYDPNYFDTYDKILDALISPENYVKILVYMGEDKYVDILTWDIYLCNDVFEFINGEPDEDYYINNVVAFGFINFTHEFYDYFYNKVCAGEPIPSIYAVIVDYPYDDGILPVITDDALEALYGLEWRAAIDELLNKLHEYI